MSVAKGPGEEEGWSAPSVLPRDPQSSLSGFEMLAEGQGLELIVRLEVGAIKPLWYAKRMFQTELAEQLAIFKQKGDIVRSNFQDGFCSTMFAVPIAEARVKEAGIVRA